MKKYIYVVFAAIALMASGCSADFLTRYPDGGSISQDQFDQLGTDRLAGTLRGLYSMIYTDGSDSHDVFGQRSIDLWGDLLCGDIALTGKTYGWLYTDEQMQTAIARNGYVWSFYYRMIHNINTTIGSINSQADILAMCGDKNWPSDGKEYTAEQTIYALYLAQALALRGYAYSNIARWFTPTTDCVLMEGFTIADYRCAPYYDEQNMDNAQPRSYSEEVYNNAFLDLQNAIRLFEEFGVLYAKQTGSEYVRESKLSIDVNVARGLLAFAALNTAPYYNHGSKQEQALYQLALDKAKDVIASGAFSQLTADRLLTTGFNNVDEPSWMWAQKVTVETTGGLKSWFGQVDIHTYSYAWAGDTKVIDANLRDAIPLWDARRSWFNDGKKNKKFKDCPDGKFFSAASPTSTNTDDIDREWLSDNVFMRYESMILIAAEASYRLEDYAGAATYLRMITDERIDAEYPFAADEYADFTTSLSTPKTLLEAIYQNWRLELWGEGYGLATYRRFPEYEERVRGGNHDYNGGGRVHKGDVEYNMQIPSSEVTYNPMIPEDVDPQRIARYTRLTEKEK